MNWTARYVAQVKSYLPAKDRDDVAEEIRSLLEDKILDREEELQRSLNEQETFALLKDFGHPLKVATAYRNNGVLISEELFPIYLLVLRYLVITLAALFAVSFAVSYVTENNSSWPGIGLGDLVNMGVFYFGLITLGFHLTDKALQKRDFLANWNPGKLPDENAETESLFSIVITLIIVLVWLKLLTLVPVEHTLDELFGRNDNRLATFVLWLKLQATATIPVYIWLLLHPQWTTGKRVMIIIADLAVVVGGAICLTIDGAQFVNVLAETFPNWNPSIEKVTVTTWIIGGWVAAVALGIANEIRKILRNPK